jgi:hypothetical protein
VVPSYDTDTDEPLTLVEQERAFKLSARQARMMNRIAAGGVVNGKAPGVREIAQMLALKASFSQAKPVRTTGESTPTAIYVISPFAKPGEPPTIKVEVRDGELPEVEGGEK